MNYLFVLRPPPKRREIMDRLIGCVSGSRPGSVKLAEPTLAFTEPPPPSHWGPLGTAAVRERRQDRSLALIADFREEEEEREREREREREEEGA